MNPFTARWKRGPIGRMEYIGNVLGSLSWIAISLPLFLVRNGSADLFLRGMALFAVIISLSELVTGSTSRLKDLDESPVQAWVLLIPGFDLYFIAVLMARRGKTTPPERDPDIPWWQLGNLGWLQPRLSLAGGIFAVLMAAGLYLVLILTHAFIRM